MLNPIEPQARRTEKYNVLLFRKNLIAYENKIRQNFYNRRNFTLSVIAYDKVLNKIRRRRGRRKDQIKDIQSKEKHWSFGEQDAQSGLCNRVSVYGNRIKGCSRIACYRLRKRFGVIWLRQLFINR